MQRMKRAGPPGRQAGPPSAALFSGRSLQCIQSVSFMGGRGGREGGRAWSNSALLVSREFLKIKAPCACIMLIDLIVVLFNRAGNELAESKVVLLL